MYTTNASLTWWLYTSQVDDVITNIWQQWARSEEHLTEATRSIVNVSIYNISTDNTLLVPHMHFPKALEEWFERRRGVTQAYASQNTEVCGYCIAIHLYRCSIMASYFSNS